MKTLKLLVCFSLFTFHFSLSYGQTLFQKSWGDSLDDAIYSAVMTKDGGFVVSGYTQQSNNPAINDLYLAKLCANGTLVWSKKYGAATSQVGQYMKQTSDGGFIMCGFGFYNPDFYGALLIKTDSLGNMQWEKEYPCYENNMLNYVQQTKDGGYIATGSTSCGAGGYIGLLLLKTDANGNLKWSKTIGGSTQNTGNYVEQTTDGGYAVGGLFNGYAYLVKTDSNGTVLWTRTFDGTADAEAYSMTSTPDKGYILAGMANKYTTYAFYNVYVVKTDSMGNIQWSKIYGADKLNCGEWANDIEVVPSGGYILAGTTNSYGAGGDDAYLIRIDTGGALLWSKVYGGPMQEIAYKVIPLPDKGFFIGGETVSFSNGSSDFYIIRTDSLGNCNCHDSVAGTGTRFVTTVVDSGYSESRIGRDSEVTLNTFPYYPPFRTLCGDSIACQEIETGSEIITNKPNIDIYPNPCSSSTTISIHNPQTTNHYLELYDITGRNIKQTEFAGNSYTLSAEGLAKGMYFVRVMDKNNNVIGTSKLVVQ